MCLPMHQCYAEECTWPRSYFPLRHACPAVLQHNADPGHLKPEMPSLRCLSFLQSVSLKVSSGTMHQAMSPSFNIRKCWALSCPHLLVLLLVFPGLEIRVGGNSHKKTLHHRDRVQIHTVQTQRCRRHGKQGHI